MKESGIVVLHNSGVGAGGGAQTPGVEGRMNGSKK